MATTKKTTKEDVKTLDTSILHKPRVTEKTAIASEKSVYVFDVSTTVTKSEIAKAFQKNYKHKPVKVNIVTSKPKATFRKGKVGFSTKSRKAYVYLPKGVTIELM